MKKPYRENKRNYVIMGVFIVACVLVVVSLGAMTIYERHKQQSEIVDVTDKAEIIIVPND